MANLGIIEAIEDDPDDDDDGGDTVNTQDNEVIEVEAVAEAGG